MMPAPEALAVPEGFKRRALEVGDYHRGLAHWVRSLSCAAAQTLMPILSLQAT